MIVTRSLQNQSWTDISSPTKEELDSLSLSGLIDPLLAKDLLSPTPKQGVRYFGGAIYVVLRIPSFNHSRLACSEQEIDFVINETSIVTGRYDSIDALHHFAKQVEVNEVLRKNPPTHLFFGLIKEVYSSLCDEAEYLSDWVKEIEKNIFEGREKEMVWSISVAERNFLNFKRVLSPHKEIWQSMKESGEFGEKWSYDFRELIEEWQRLLRSISDIGEMLNALRETNNALLSTKQNEIMKIFTILAFVTFPLSLVASIFGMNTDYIPIVGHLYDFWIVMGLMFLMSLAMFVYFKHKEWI